MATPQKPFNISLMKLDENRLRLVPRITSPEIYDGSRGQFHPQGLFSSVLFGDVGTTTRDYTFGYFKLNTTILHPYVCKWITKLKRMYESIWRGEIYAIFDPKTGEFVKSDPENGDTGYAFFMKYLDKLKFEKNNSVKRNVMIDNFEKYRDRLTLRYHLVLPAGLRDLIVKENGKASEDEVNELYRKLLRYSIALEGTPKNQGSEVDGIRVNMQMVVNQIYAYFETLLSGKKGFLLKRWGSRNLHYGTRNVISSMDSSTEDIDAPNAPKVDDIMMGMYQFLKGSAPLAIYHVRNNPLWQLAFPSNNDYANLINPKTLQRETVYNLDDTLIDAWTTLEGIEKTIDKFEKPSFRTKPITIGDYYYGLIYRDHEKFMLLDDILALPEGWDRKYVRPITYIEYLYIVVSQYSANLFAQVTRYPVTNEYSTYVASIYLKSTTERDQLEEYEHGQPTGKMYYEFPILENPTFYNSMSVHPTAVSLLGADFDGDTCSCNILMSEESIAECRKLLTKRTSTVMAGNNLRYNVENDIVKRALLAITAKGTGRRSTRGDTPR